MDPVVEREIRRVFAILPEREAQDAVSATLARLSGAALPPALLKWAVFTPRGGFLRGGLSTLADYVTTYLARPEEDGDVAALAAEAADGGAEPGRTALDSSGERFFWFLPGAETAADAPPREIVFGFVIDLPVFEAIHSHFNAGRGLTGAERRALFQLVAGFSLREAAARDGVSTETRRSQIKSAAAKMQCSGQTDLVRLSLGQLTRVLAVAEGESALVRTAEGFVAAHLPGDARLTTVRLPNGRLMRLVEAGPPDGRPVVAVHGMMFGMLLSGARPHLEAAGLRLIVPLRSGYLDTRPLIGLDAKTRLIEADLADLALWIESRNLAPAVLLGHSLGAPVAAAFAAARPALVSRLILLSANPGRPAMASDPLAKELYEGYRNLSARGGLARAVTLEFSRHYPNEASARAILERMFGAAPADRAAMEGEGAAASVYGWFPDLYAASVAGIAEDYAFAMDGAGAQPPQGMPVLALHGGEDPLCPPGDAFAFAGSGARAVIIPGAGHFAPASHPAPVWEAVGAFARGEEKTG